MMPKFIFPHEENLSLLICSGPTSIFPEHGVPVWLEGTVDGNNHKIYKRVANPAELKFEPLQITITGRKTGNNLSWEITGDEFNFNFDALNGGTEGASIEWYIVAPAERKSILLPEFTEELQAIAAEFGNYREVELLAAGGLKFPSGNKSQKYQNMIEFMTDRVNGSKSDILWAYKRLDPGANGRLRKGKGKWEGASYFQR